MMAIVTVKGKLECYRFANGEVYLRELAYRMGIDIEIDKVVPWFTGRYYFTLKCEKEKADKFCKVMENIVEKMYNA